LAVLFYTDITISSKVAKIDELTAPSCPSLQQSLISPRDTLDISGRELRKGHLQVPIRRVLCRTKSSKRCQGRMEMGHDRNQPQQEFLAWQCKYRQLDGAMEQSLGEHWMFVY
jgi:hypothetical protein